MRENIYPVILAAFVIVAFSVPPTANPGPLAPGYGKLAPPKWDSSMAPAFWSDFLDQAAAWYSSKPFSGPVSPPWAREGSDGHVVAMGLLGDQSRDGGSSGDQVRMAGGPCAAVTTGIPPQYALDPSCAGGVPPYPLYCFPMGGCY